MPNYRRFLRGRIFPPLLSTILTLLLTACGDGTTTLIGASTGTGIVSVPAVMGMTQATASSTISGAGLTVGTVTMSNSATVPSGSVISQSPSAGTMVNSGSSVNFTVSSGPAPVSVPNVVAQSQAAATSAITSANLVLGAVTLASSATVPTGNVISQSPAAGSSVAAGSAVNLTVSSGPAPFWVPVNEVPANSSGINGLGVLPSNFSNLSSLTQIQGDNEFDEIGTINANVKNGSTFAYYSPYAHVYLGLGADGNRHIESLPLTNLTSTPTAVQLTSLSVPSTYYVWSLQWGYTSFFDPTTAFILVGVGPPDHSSCTTYLVRLSDSATVAPIQVASQCIGVAGELYDGNGAMTGIVAQDTSGNLNFYPASGFPNFTSPQLIAANAVFIGQAEVRADRANQLLSGGTLMYLDVLDETTNVATVWRIDAAGNATTVYASSGVGDFPVSVTHDNANLYFLDLVRTKVASTTTQVYTVLSAPLSGGTATALYTTPAYPLTHTVSLIDSDGSRLILQSADTSQSPANYSLLTLPITGASNPATLVAYTDATFVYGFLDFASGNLFVNKFTAAGPLAGVVPSASTAAPTLTPGAHYVMPGVQVAGEYSAFAWPTVLMVNNISSSTSWQGASLFAVNPSTLAATSIGAYPTTSIINFLTPVTPTLFYADTTANSSGNQLLLIDLTKDVAFSTAVPNTDFNGYY